MMARLLNCPAEILLQVAELSSLADKNSMSMTCRTMYNFVVQSVLVPVLVSADDAQVEDLYRNIDLSSHNASIKSPCQGYPVLPVPLNFIERQWTSLDRGVRERQDLFIRGMQENPSTAKYVRHLKWTVLPNADDLWPDEVLIDRDYEASLHDEDVPAVYPPEDSKSFSSDCRT